MSKPELPTVTPDDVDGPEDGMSGDCEYCDGDGTVECSECGGSGTDPEDEEDDELCCACFGSTYEDCDICDGSALSLDTRKHIAAEATRLWHRDIGRGVTTGTKDVYIAFAFESLREGRKAA